MRCSIPFCTNVALREDGQHISFFNFPKDPNIRKEWRYALGINWEPTKSNFICSEHFRPEDLYETAAGIRMLHDGALPVKILDWDSLAALRVCRICLALDSKMYDFSIFEQMFEQITGILTKGEARRLPKRLCWECAARLKAAAAFRDKAFISDGMLHDLLKTSNQIKIRDVKVIDRLNSGLKTHLVQTVINCEHYELKVNDTFVETVLNSDSDSEILNNDNKVEILEPNTVKNIPALYENTLPEELDTKNTNDFTTDIDMLFDDFDYSDDVIQIKNNTEAELKEDMLKHIIEITEPLHEEMNVTKIPVQKNNPNKMVLRDLNSDDDETDEKDFNNVVTAGDSESEEIYEHVDINKYVTKVPAISVQKDKSGARYHRFSKKEIIPIDETIFEITQLSYDQQMKEVEARKDTPGYKNAPYKCTVCYKAFLFKDSYNSHMFRHNEKNGAHECYICTKRLKTPQSLRTHLLATHTVQYNCKLCKFCTRHRHGALTHMKFHQGKKYKCSMCPMEFNTPSTYFGHLRFKHMFDWVCDLCGYTFVSTSGLKLHKMKKHRVFDEATPREGPHCDVCDIKFLTQNAYDTHLKVSSKHLNGEHDPTRIRNEPSIHAARASQKSPRVPRPIKSRQPRGRNKPVTCEQCGIEFCTFLRYEQHFARHHPGVTMTQTRKRSYPAMCEQCGQIFTRTGLKQHMLVHNKEKRFKCDNCNKAFNHKGCLARHVDTHSGREQKSRQCPTCHKYYYSLSNLNKHLLIHTGLKPYQCGTCKKCFTTSYECRVHIKHVHLNIPWPRNKKRDREKNRKAARVEN